jgi:pimeloyl-ACP methyl ester carboxylesterase
MRTLIFAFIVSACLSLAGFGLGGDAARGASTLEWTECGDGLECATVPAPLDYARPSGREIDIALARLPAAGARIGSLLVNPGGPGASGVDFLRSIAAEAPAALHERFDIIGFDPRGTGGTIPIDCTENPTTFTDLDPTPDTPSEESELFAAARDFANDCRRRNSDILEFIDTVSSARDIEAIRVALDEETISYFGYSYGTQLGATYAGLYPERVRAFVLDGALDPALSAEDLVIEQARGFESALNAFLADCSANLECVFTAPDGDLGAALDEILADADRDPLPVEGDTRTVNEGVAMVGVLTALYDKEFGWPLLAESLASAQEGDGSGLQLLADFYNDRQEDGSYSNLLETYFAIECLDQPFPRGEDGYESLLPEILAVAPRTGPSVAAGTNLPCAFWPIEATGDPAPIRAAGAAPILVVGTTNDPATPYSWSQALASQLESGVLLTREGEGHTAYQQGSACIDAAIETYLVTLQPPPDNTVCQQDDAAGAPAPLPVSSPTPPSGSISAPDTGAGAPSGGRSWGRAAAAALIAGVLLVIAGERAWRRARR